MLEEEAVDEVALTVVDSEEEEVEDLVEEEEIGEEEVAIEEDVEALVGDKLPNWPYLRKSCISCMFEFVRFVKYRSLESCL